MNASRKRNSALDKLEEFRFIILEHILKLSLLPEHDSCRHWQQEINSYAKRLRKYNKGKSGKPNFTNELLWEYLWEDQSDELPLGFLESYGVTQVNLQLNDIKEKIQSFILAVLSDQ